MADSTSRHSVLIIGGGLAGMTAALRLAQRGAEVCLIEASDRLGGKAGADRHGSDRDEHGWHLFPLWYVNIWGLIDELGIRGNFEDRTRYAYMREGEYPRTVYLENPFSWRTAWHNIFHGLLQPAEAVLYQYVLLDLMSQPVRLRASLDQVTVNGFARSRLYCTDAVVDQLEDTVSRASAIESYEMSAMTVRNVMRYWFRYHDPWFRILKTDLQRGLIEPFERELRKAGCRILLGHRAVEFVLAQGEVSAVMVGAADGHTERMDVGTVISAVPAECVRDLLTPQLQHAAPALRGTFYLRSRIMAGMTIYMKERVVGVPRDHVNFVGTSYETSVIDVTDVWRLDRTVLCVVVSDYTALQKHSVAEAKAVLLADLQRFFPFLTSEAIDRVDLQPHVGQPLFANTAGAWPSRPKESCEVSNLFLAGDYCQSDVDLTCMEGAVATGLRAANAVRQRLGIPDSIEVRTPEVHSRLYLVLLKWLLAPVALAAFCYSKFVTGPGDVTRAGR